MTYKVLSEILMVLHFLWIVFMLYGFVLTIRGLWQPSFWDRWLFRSLHLLGILFVAAMPLLDRLCPLTEWEYQLRSKYDPNAEYSGSFIIDWLEKIIYPDVPLEVVLIPTFLIAGFTFVMYILRPPLKIRGLFRNRM